MRFKDQVALVVGASSGIGHRLALRLAREGAVTFAVARSEAKLEQLTRDAAQAGGTIIPHAADATCEADIARLFARIADHAGRLDLLINSAGVSIGGPTHELDLAAWRTVWETNVTSVFLACRGAIKLMLPRRSGRIINIGSVSAKVSRPHSAPYTTSKFALDGLTRSLALDYRDAGISVGVIHPGNTDTPIWAGARSRADEEGIMSTDTVAEVVLMAASLPHGVSLLDSVVMPITMPLVGRG